MKKTTEIIKILPTIISNGPNDETRAMLKNLDLNENEINEILDIVCQGIGRVGLYETGMKPEQFSSYLDENPIFQKTIDLASNSEIEYDVDTDNLHPKLKKAFKGDSNEKIDFEKLLSEFNNPKNKNRDSALYDLITNDYPNISPLVEQSLFDNDKMVQITALQGINENILNQNLEKKLIELFKLTDNHTLVSNITYVFSSFFGVKAIPFIMEKMKSENLMIVYDCIICLGNIGDNRVIDDLIPFKEIRETPEIYDENGFIEQTTQYSIRKITKKTIKKLKKVPNNVYKK
ncbi:hypothetical protein [Tenacibaculum finnmarkense]|uniref:hypothetical protein n=1 Tax=Tenacibaculum finnmarkense TaxID=2781243 RepID=UPI001E3C06EF|nr:hypothetical protein [Tenacibaculum finnmarkense]MCD8423561.1 hypothetical protein [Tenacibaculum finnmarkense genomovar ulcerans]MCG8239705.1 hypothetical protein [Tenacibaculum finnmarkense genomovar ulcerans]WCC46197.1 hypothetical protein PJH08_07245 [Tenacibaculum finnmarkense]